MPVNPAGGQPLQPYFDLTLGGLERIYDSPNIPIQLTLEEDISMVHRIEINLFDEAGYEVEPYIWVARDPLTHTPGGSFQFGYKGDLNLDSERYNLQINHYTVSYEKNAFAVNIFGTTKLSPIATSYQYSGTLEDVIAQFVANHNLEVRYTPPIGVQNMQSQGLVDHENTGPRETLFSKWSNESDWRFLNRILKFAQSQDDPPKAGYQPYITCENGQNILHICLPPTGATGGGNGADLRYVVQDPDSVVVSWRPEIIHGNYLGAWGTHSNGAQPGTGMPTKHALDPSVTSDNQTGLFGADPENIPNVKSTPDTSDPAQIVNGPPESIPFELTQGAVRNRSHGRADPFSGLTGPGGLAWHLQQVLTCMKAELTVLGDPTLELVPNMTCDVLFYYPINYLNNNIRQVHYTSGRYWVKGIRHVIRAGSYLTTLKLERAAMPNLPLELQAGGPGVQL